MHGDELEINILKPPSLEKKLNFIYFASKAFIIFAFSMEQDLLNLLNKRIFTCTTFLTN